MSAKRHKWVSLGDQTKRCEVCGMGIKRDGRGWAWQLRAGRAALISDVKTDHGTAPTLAGLPECGAGRRPVQTVELDALSF